MVTLSAIIAIFLHVLALTLTWISLGPARLMAIALAIGALAIALLGASVCWSRGCDTTALRLAPRLLQWLAAINLAGHVLMLAGLHALLKRSPLIPILIAVMALPIIASYGRFPLIPPRSRFPIALAISLLVGSWLIRVQPEPY